MVHQISWLYSQHVLEILSLLTTPMQLLWSVPLSSVITVASDQSPVFPLVPIAACETLKIALFVSLEPSNGSPKWPQQCSSDHFFAVSHTISLLNFVPPHTFSGDMWNFHHGFQYLYQMWLLVHYRYWHWEIKLWHHSFTSVQWHPSAMAVTCSPSLL
jgi:hypothetical protein